MLTMTGRVAAAITAQAKAELPHEACGYLAADESGLVVRHYPMTNIDRSGEHFSMDPAEQFAAVKDMRRRGLSLRAVFHSHPETPARPSAEDLRLAFDPKISYVIVSLAGREPVIKSFRIKNGEAAPEELIIEEET